MDLVPSNGPNKSKMKYDQPRERVLPLKHFWMMGLLYLVNLTQKGRDLMGSPRAS